MERSYQIEADWSYEVYVRLEPLQKHLEKCKRVSAQRKENRIMYKWGKGEIHEVMT